MQGYCSHCPKRETCTIPCDKILEYADQDYVGREQAFNIHGVKTWKGAIQFRVPINPEDRAKEAWLLHKQGKSIEDISIHLECDENFIREVLEE